MADVRFLLAQIIGFVIGAAVLGLVVGWLLGRATGRFASVRFDRARDEEFVFVRPDVRLFDENEQLRDQNSVLEAKVTRLALRVTRAEGDLHVAEQARRAAQDEVAHATDRLAALRGARLAGGESEVTDVGSTGYPVGESADLPNENMVGSESVDIPDDLGSVAAAGRHRDATSSARLPGVSAVHAARLADARIHDVGDLAELDTAGLTRVANETGIPVWRLHLWRVAGRTKRRTK